MKQRTITSVFIVLTTLLAVLSKFLPFTIGDYIFDIFVLFIVIVAGFESAQIFEGLNKRINKFLATMYGVFNYITILICAANFKFKYVILAQVVSLAIYGVIIFVTECFAYKQESSREHLNVTLNTLLACLYPTFWFCLMLAINHSDIFVGVKYFSLIFIILVFAITMLTDTFAYLVGSALKGPKLAPKISPKKTISGAIGGLLGGVAGAMLVFALCQAPLFQAVLTRTGYAWWHFLIFGVIGSVIGQAGDLFESFLKRKAGVKDSGTMFPGHGGMLDRIDAMSFVATFVFILVFIVVL